MNPSSSPCNGLGPDDDLPDDWDHLSTESLDIPSLDGSSEVRGELEQRGKLKSKLVSAWNNVKYGWSLKQKSRFSKSSPVTMLGECFLLSSQVERALFRQSFASFLWLTYRRGFPQLEGSSLTTDSGWGCMLRSGQMLLAQGLKKHLLPPDWVWPSDYHVFRDDMDVVECHSQSDPDCGRSDRKTRSRGQSLSCTADRRTEATHRRLVSWCGDHSSAPFGLHQLIESGKSFGKKAGDWYGPSIVAHILRKAVAASNELPHLTVYVAQDCTVYLEDVRRLCERLPAEGSSVTSASWKSVIVLVPVRLGGGSLNPSYVECVKKLLMLECCIGIIGGKPKHSLFFVGYQDDHLLYLDPHYSQSTVDTTQDNFPLESFHCRSPRKMAFTRMDPSCTIGFYAKGQKEFKSLCTDVSLAFSGSTQKYPMFSFVDGGGPDLEEGSMTHSDSVTHILSKERLRRTDTSNSMDEFVLL
ncbi:cysteine protease atg4da-like [Aplochiton taeniatus]